MNFRPTFSNRINISISSKDKRVKRITNIISDSKDPELLLHQFQRQAFLPGNPVRIGRDLKKEFNPKEAWRESPFPIAQKWFTFSPVHRADDVKPKWFCRFKRATTLKSMGAIMLPYELILSKSDTELSTGIDRLQAFRDYLHVRSDRKLEVKAKSFSSIVEEQFAVPVDLLSSLLPSDSDFSTIANHEDRFYRFHAPLSLLFEADQMRQDSLTPLFMTGLYAAQVNISDLPDVLRKAFPTPMLVQKAGRGDVYGSNLWLGLAPTYTPLHKDPNPNLFYQIINTKVVRLFRPEVGQTIFEDVQKRIGRQGSATIRGEEMMQGVERRELHDAAWNCPEGTEMYEVSLHSGQTLYIPQGWWHSIKSQGDGVNCSANFWFR